MSIEQARAYFAREAYAAFLGIQLVDLGAEHAVLRLPFVPEHTNAVGPLNGGASASLMNMAGAIAAWAGLDLDMPLHLGCVDLSIQYLSAAMQEDIVAVARVVRRGRDLLFLRIDIHTPQDKPICQGQITYRGAHYGVHKPREHSVPALLPALETLRPWADPWLFRNYVTKLSIVPLHRQPGRLRLRMPCTPQHLDAQSRLHAGAVASLIDVAGTAAAWSMLPDRSRARGATIGMQIGYTQPTASAVVADAHLQQRSEEIFISTVQVTAEDTGQLVALGQVTYRLIEPR
jgi:uncharacterized protein (TIGR00369 family)